ncbi:MAG: HEAT repeat domain-containing protein [Planctomycetota bacterium]
MNRSKRKRIIFVLALATISLVAYGATWTPYLLESWKIDQLDSEDPQIRDAAATWLGERKVARAAPKLVELFWSEPDSLIPATTRNNTVPHPAEYIVSPVGEALVQIGKPAAEALVDAWHPSLPNVHHSTKDRAQWLVCRIGEESLPALVSCVTNHEDKYCFRRTLWVLGAMGETARSSKSALLARARREEAKVAEGIRWVVDGIWKDSYVRDSFLPGNLFRDPIRTSGTKSP